MDGKMFCLLTGKLAVLKAETENSPQMLKKAFCNSMRSSTQQQLPISILDSNKKQNSQHFTFTEFISKVKMNSKQTGTPLSKSKIPPIEKLQILIKQYGNFVREIELGSTFGERTLSGCLNRTATIVTIVRSVVIQINKSDFEPLQRNLQRILEKKEQALISVFPNLKGQYSSANLDSMKYSFNVIFMKKYYQGNILTQEGKSGDQLIFIIVKGMVQVSKIWQPNNQKDHSYINPVEIKMSMLTQGQFIGEELLFEENQKYEYTCTVKSKSMWVLQGKKLIIEHKFFAEEREVLYNSWQAKLYGRQNILKKLQETQEYMGSNLYFQKGLDVKKSLIKTNYQQFNNNLKRGDFGEQYSSLSISEQKQSQQKGEQRQQQQQQSSLSFQKFSRIQTQNDELLPFVHSNTNLNKKLSTIINFANLTAANFNTRKLSPKQQFELPVLDFGKGEKHDHLQILRRFRHFEEKKKNQQQRFKSLKLMNYFKNKVCKNIQKWRQNEKETGGSVDLEEYQETCRQQKTILQKQKDQKTLISQIDIQPNKGFQTFRSEKQDYSKHFKKSSLQMTMYQNKTGTSVENNSFHSRFYKEQSNQSFYQQQSSQNPEKNLSFSLINLKNFNQQDGLKLKYINRSKMFKTQGIAALKTMINQEKSYLSTKNYQLVKE